MKIKILLISLLIAIANVANADKIDEATALGIAQKFFKTNIAKSKSAAMDGSLKLAHASTGYYAFNCGTDGGFVLVAADDKAVAEVLGYSDNGSFASENLPCNVKEWLSEYDSQIEYAASLTGGYEETTAQTTAAYADVEPMIQTMWGQRQPYNQLCPMINGTEECPTGCVATAGAQVMYYHRWPETGTGSFSYLWRDSVTLSADFSQSTYEWDKMLTVYDDDTYSSESGYAVAKLMSDVGVAVEMDYDTDGSGTPTLALAKALNEFFYYDNGIEYLSREYYDDEEWADTLYKELANARPVVYGGRTSENGGHAFVIDGYKEGFFHVNWGWNGSYNGYYLLSALGAKKEYNYKQKMIVGIKKAEEASDYKLHIFASDFYVSSKTRRYVDFGQDFRYRGLCYGYFVLGIRLEDIETGESENVCDYYCECEGISNTGVSYRFEQMTINLNDVQASDGNYRVYPIYAKYDPITYKNGECYDVRVDRSGNQYLTLNINNGVFTFGEPEETGIATVVSSDDAACEVYTIGGMLLERRTTSDGALQGKAPGLYILKSGNKVRKVAVK